MRRTTAAILGVCALSALASMRATAELTPARGLVDPRVRVVAYDPEQVIKLHGFVGYQIHFQFAEGETFVNLAAGDNKALDVGYEANHLVLKPLAEKVATNITVLTNRRVYQFDYSASAARPDPDRQDVIYSLRFIYPQDEARKAAEELEQQRMNLKLAGADQDSHRARNSNYWGCGAAAIRPASAYDDGVQTRLKFAAHSEFPTLYVKNDDDSESLVNFTVDHDEVVIHRVARGFVLRRGKLAACLQNRSFDGGGERLESQTLVPGVERITKGVKNP
ncbi:MAG: type secretion system protein VirB9 [Gammaproteobacteria bacterium]|jgi:type IV secretion system protein VirB9|nr:type secretion system protein VirB9 [Gammaproteobacteria bacterium]